MMDICGSQTIAAYYFFPSLIVYFDLLSLSKWIVCEFSSLMTFQQCSTQANLITNLDLDSLSVSIENKGPRTWILGTTTPILIESTGRMIKFSVVLCTFLLHGSIFIGVQPLRGAEIFVSVEDVTFSIQIA